MRDRLSWSDVVGDTARQSLPHMAILPHETRGYEFKSLVPVKPRCGENVVRKMLMLFPKFASGCLNAQVDGHMFFGVVDGKSENDAACARELGWIGADEQLEHGQLVGVRLPKPARGHMADWLQPQISPVWPVSVSSSLPPSARSHSFAVLSAEHVSARVPSADRLQPRTAPVWPLSTR